MTIYNRTGTILSASAYNNSYFFTAREYDTETGQYYYRARYYDAGLGRFLEIDPIGYAGGINLYGYVRNNPWNRVDPFGLLDAKGGFLYSEEDFDNGVKNLADGIQAENPNVSREEAESKATEIMQEMGIGEANKVKGLLKKQDYEGLRKLLEEIYDRAQKKKCKGS